MNGFCAAVKQKFLCNTKWFLDPIETGMIMNHRKFNSALDCQVRRRVYFISNH